MLRRFLCNTMLVSVVVALVVACGGKGAGDSCTKDEDCSSNLTCQAISGRPTTLCCPTPATASPTSPSCSAAGGSGASDAGAGG